MNIFDPFQIQIGRQHCLASAIGVVLAVVTMFLAMHFVHKLYSAFAAPIAVVDSVPMEGQAVDYQHGVIWLYASYLLSGFVLAYTGCTIGMSADEFNLEKTGSHLVWGFSVGILVAALARISAVYFTTSLAQYMQLLTVGAAGILAYKVTTGEEFLTHFVDHTLRPAGGDYFIAFAVVTTICACASVEVLIYSLRNSRRANLVPLALLMERREQFNMVEQSFWPGGETNFTEGKMQEIIEKEGLEDLCWITHIAPEKHLTSVFDALVKYCQRNGGPEGPHDLATRIMCAKVRIIVTSRENYTKLLSLSLPFINKRAVCCADWPVAERQLLINKRHAFIHLPIPFRTAAQEQSNCAMYLRAHQYVHPLGIHFDAIWDDVNILRNTLQQPLRQQVVANFQCQDI